jgi:Holliday junction DNA helicase RuvB
MRPSRKTKDARAPRPLLDDLAGQDRLKPELKRLILAARRANRPIDHILLLGPDGTGKAVFAHATANEIALTLVSPSHDVLDDPVALLDVMVGMRLGSILFVERIDRLCRESREVVAGCIAKRAPEALVPLLHRRASHKIELLPFPIIATAETLPKELSRLALAGCFAKGRLQALVMDPYTASELAAIVRRAAAEAGFNIEPNAAELIAFYAEGSPGRALTIFRRICKSMDPALGGTIRLEAARKALRVIGYG